VIQSGQLREFFAFGHDVAAHIGEFPRKSQSAFVGSIPAAKG
jgi:hypothetical protein